MWKTCQMTSRRRENVASVMKSNQRYLSILYKNSSFIGNGITDIQPLMNDSVAMTLPTETMVNN